jgi:hypothetical protein
VVGTVAVVVVGPTARCSPRYVLSVALRRRYPLSREKVGRCIAAAAMIRADKAVDGNPVKIR